LVHCHAATLSARCAADAHKVAATYPHTNPNPNTDPNTYVHAHTAPYRVAAEHTDPVHYANAAEFADSD
jgi:hypothetical protein